MNSYSLLCIILIINVTNRLKNKDYLNCLCGYPYDLTFFNSCLHPASKRVRRTLHTESKENKDPRNQVEKGFDFKECFSPSKSTPKSKISEEGHIDKLI